MSRASEIAYSEIRSRILSGALAPGTQLKEEELAEYCGVSRTPVRDALRRLEAEMLVRRSETQRTFVPEWSTNEVEEIFSLRTLVESHAAVRACANIDDAQLARLQAANDSLHDAISQPQPDPDAFLAHNKLFHDIIFEASCSERLAKMRALLIDQVILHRTTRRYDQDGLVRSHVEHEELILALSHRDAQWAAAIMTNHIRRAYHVTVA